MQKGGVIMDVTTPEQARIAEEAGAVAVMALQAVPADIRKAGGVARMADPEIVQQIIDTVTIPVMAKARIGHFVEAEILEALGVDMVDESEVLTPADPYFHIDKTQFTVPFVCGARNLGEALRRINEGAAMIRTKGEAGTGDVSQAVKHMKQIQGEIRALAGKTKEELDNGCQGNRSSYRTRDRNFKDAAPACSKLCSRRNCNPCRCGSYDAPWSGRGLCRLRHFQSRKP